MYDRWQVIYTRLCECARPSTTKFNHYGQQKALHFVCCFCYVFWDTLHITYCNVFIKFMDHGSLTSELITSLYTDVSWHKSHWTFLLSGCMLLGMHSSKYIVAEQALDECHCRSTTSCTNTRKFVSSAR